jgi:hypothetical protein
MQRILIVFTGLFAGSMVIAENVEDADRLLCSASQVMMCFETGECFTVPPWEIDVPQFVVIDKNKKAISTTKGSGENRSTPIATVHEEGGDIFLQGFEQGRAFSIVINESLGTLNAAVARDGVSVAVFGACTNAET